MIEASEVYIPEIDEQKTILNGKKLCTKYQPLVERRIKKNLTIPIYQEANITFLPLNIFSTAFLATTELSASGEINFTSATF